MGDSKPWYKQLWPWVLMSIPFSVIIAMSITLTLASKQSGAPMVIDDYYKEGRGINTEISKVVEAQKRDITFEFQTDGDRFTLKFLTGQPEELTALSVRFYHATLDNRDLKVTVTADANGVFRGQLPKQTSGHWTITVLPFDESWRLSQRLTLPSTKSLVLEPKTYGV